MGKAGGVMGKMGTTVTTTMSKKNDNVKTQKIIIILEHRTTEFALMQILKLHHLLWFYSCLTFPHNE